MTDTCESCPHERVHKVEYKALRDSVDDLRTRVTRLEVTLTRGMMLLMANLVGMVISLARGFINV